MEFVVFFKLFSLLVIFSISFIGGLVPIYLSQKVQNTNTFLSYTNCLSAGILLGAALIDLLNDAESITFDYPLAHLFCSIGFFSAFTIQKVFFVHNHHHHHHHHQDVPLVDTTEHHIQLEEQNNELEEQNVHHHDHENPTTGYLLLIVLSMDSFFAGGALGVSHNNSETLVLLLAISTHIWAESFALCKIRLNTDSDSIRC